MDLELHLEGPELLGLVPARWPPAAVTLLAVLPKSAAEHQGLRRGDELVEVNGKKVGALDQRGLALELAARPLSLKLIRPEEAEVVIDVQVGADEGALGFFPKHWPPGPVVVGAVIPNKIAERFGVRENDVLWRVAKRQASLMSPAELTRALSERPVELRFVRGSRSVAKDLAENTETLNILEETRNLQVQQLHLQQLQHQQEQDISYVSHGRSWLALLEKQREEKRSVEATQRRVLARLEESLQKREKFSPGAGQSYASRPVLSELKAPPVTLEECVMTSEPFKSMQSQTTQTELAKDVSSKAVGPEINTPQSQMTQTELCEATTEQAVGPEVTKLFPAEIPLKYLEPKQPEHPRTPRSEIALSPVSLVSTSASPRIKELVLRELPPPLRPPKSERDLASEPSRCRP